MPELISGYTDGQKWIAGAVPIKPQIMLDVDTRTGKGVLEIMNYMRDFISYQASKTFLPSYSTEDVVQEMNALALMAIPEYDATKCANMLTFLQHHLHNRIINIYKCATKRQRLAVHGNFRLYNVKCPKCHHNMVIDGIIHELKRCVRCGHAKTEGDQWKKYPVPIGTLSANEHRETFEGSEISVQDSTSYDDISLLTGRAEEATERKVLSRIAIENILEQYDALTSEIVLLIMKGYNLSEISRSLNTTLSKVKGRVRKIARSKQLAQILEDYI